MASHRFTVPTGLVALDTAPISAVAGDSYFDTTTGSVRTYDGSGWVGANEVYVGTTAPTSPDLELWIDTDATGLTLDDLDARYDEVAISASQPMVARELWVDTSAADDITGGIGVLIALAGTMDTGTGLTTVVPFGNVLAMWGTTFTTANSAITVPTTGVYEAGFNLGYPSTTGGTFRAAALFRNGAQIANAEGNGIVGISGSYTGLSGLGFPAAASGLRLFTAGDLITVVARHDQGTSLAVYGSLWLRMIRAS